MSVYDAVTGQDGFLKPFLEIARKEPDRLFASFPDQEISFGKLDQLSASLTGELKRLGVGRGDHVAIMAANSASVLSLLFAIARTGAVWVPVNVKGVGDNLRYILEHSKPALVVADADRLEAIKNSCATIAQLVSIEELDSTGPTLDEVADCGPDEPFSIMYTSGTTGRPKGVIVSQRMLCLSGESSALVSEAREDDVMLLWEPLYHIGGAQMIILPIIRKARLQFIEGFSARRFWKDVKDSGTRHVHYLGGILQILLKQSPSELDLTHGAEIAWGGGCPRDIWRAFEDRFGVRIRECYGMTECSSITAANLSGTLGAVGKPMPWFNVSIETPNGVAARGEQGEIVVTTHLPGALTAGYLDNPEATGEALSDNVFHTGDLGSLDEQGNLYFHGRMSDSVRVRGENVSAFEVEHVAARHPDVEDCAMTGVSADVGEQDILLFVKLRTHSTLEPQELSDWLGERLSVFQSPRYISFVDEFERTPSQRIMKHRLPKNVAAAWDRLARLDN